MEPFVIDTSVFTNPDIYSQFGPSTQEALAVFLELAKQSRAELYMPGSVYEELRLMKDLGALAAEFELVMRIRSPRRYQLEIPAELLYEFIEEVRHRIDRGLRIAEEHTKMGQEGKRVEIGQLIRSLRERYREALRRGIIDSREDVDVLLLAYELDGILVSADEGLRTWADKVGVKILSPIHLRHALESLANPAP